MPCSIVLADDASKLVDLRICELAVCGFPLGLGLQEQDGSGGIILNPSFSSVMVSSALPYPRAPLQARTCGRILRGQYIPHPMHWDAIKALSLRAKSGDEQ
jgi:hypothetical protein